MLAQQTKTKQAVETLSLRQYSMPGAAGANLSAVNINLTGPTPCNRLIAHEPTSLSGTRGGLINSAMETAFKANALPHKLNGVGFTQRNW
jgi:hypothetical protein